MAVMDMANSLPMWLACGLAVALVLAQAIIFALHAYKAGQKMGLSESQMKRAVKSSAITSIGPSIVSLLITVGAPMAWMRLSFIGSVMFESIAAGFGTSSVGVQLGADEMTELAFCMAVWTMILGSVGWIIFATFSAGRMDKVQKKLAKGDPVMLSTIAGAAIVGSFAALSSTHLVSLNKNSLACVLGGVIMAVMIFITEKFQVKWLKEWALTFSILGSMIITVLV